jgi:hypothetical protein
LIVSLSLRGQLVFGKHLVSGSLIGMEYCHEPAGRLEHALSVAIIAGIVMGVDFLLAAIFFWLQGGLEGATAWIALLPYSYRRCIF